MTLVGNCENNNLDHSNLENDRSKNNNPENSNSEDNYLINDGVTLFLKNQGYRIHNYYLSGSQFIIGARVVLGGVELVYRVEDDTVLIILYRRIVPRCQGLGNIFSGFIWFIERLAYDVPCVNFVTGKANALRSIDQASLDSTRLIRFYQVLMGGQSQEQSGWFHFALKDYQTMRQRLRRQIQTKS